MRIAILHFHLRSGGVTRVIELAAEALKRRGLEVLVVSGEPPAGRLPPARVAVVPELAYGVGPRQAGALRRGVEEACRRRWGAEADVLHIHNHGLGKNFALPPAVAAWAEQGRAMLLQTHDFAENGRPANYRSLREHLGGAGGLSRILYPASARIAYGLLNSRDSRKLLAAGMTSACELVPNPVAQPAGGEPVERALFGASRLLVYPTRAIRRKNIGEALLWAALAAKGEKVVLTDAPVSAQDLARHEKWREFAESLGLPVVFDALARTGRPARDFLLGADLCLTTSVAEGFGMAFLEPFLAGRPVGGRDLPEITQDFAQAGLDLTGLYPRLEIPAGWLEAGEVEDMVAEAVRSACFAYDIPWSEEAVRQAQNAVCRGGRVDFGRITEDLQARVIAGLCSGRCAAAELLPAKLSADASRVAENKRVVETEFSLSAYGKKLQGIYQSLTAAPAGPVAFLNARRVLSEFLSFDGFSALCN